MQIKQGNGIMVTICLKFVNFLSKIDQIILSNLQDIEDVMHKMDNNTNKSYKGSRTNGNSNTISIRLKFDCFLSVIHKNILSNLQLW